MTDLELDAQLQAFYSKARTACLEGKYKHNRNPMNAALWDSDPEIRMGAILLILTLYNAENLLESISIDLLKLRCGIEQDDRVKAMLIAALEDLQENNQWITND